MPSTKPLDVFAQGKAQQPPGVLSSIFLGADPEEVRRIWDQVEVWAEEDRARRQARRQSLPQDQAQNPAPPRQGGER